MGLNDMPDGYQLPRDAGATSAQDQQPAPRLSGPQASVAVEQPDCEALQWFVVRHRPFEGKATRDEIRKLGFQAVHFTELVSKPRRDDVMRAFLPGYLFARWSLANPRWGGILRIPTVVGVMSTSFGKPIPVPDAEAERFLKMFDEKGVWIDAKPEIASKIGAQFEVQVGPWSKFAGECVGVDPKGRVSLMLSIFGRATVVEFHPGRVTEV